MKKKVLLVVGGVIVIIIVVAIGKQFSSSSPTSPAGYVASLQTSISSTPSKQVATSSLSVGTSTTNSQSCTIKSLTESNAGFQVYSPDGSKYLINKKDSNGIEQVYVGNTGSSALTCITCTQQTGGPRPDRFKMQATWYPSGQWIFMAVERNQFTTPPVLGSIPSYVEGQLQDGLWTNMWAVQPDGSHWTQLTNFTDGPSGTPDGYTGPAFTPDGKTLVISEIVDGNVLVYWPFGRWQLTQASVSIQNGVPALSNIKNITPTGMNWNEPGNFSPDGKSLLFSGSVLKDAEGMDQYVLDITTGKLTDLTNSPTIWDEHGMFSPDGQKIIFMSAYPYRSNTNSSKVLTIKTEFMMMNKDGSGLTQLTHFETPGYPEYSAQGGIAANPAWNPNGKSADLRQLFFPDYKDWNIVFAGACGDASSGN